MNATLIPPAPPPTFPVYKPAVAAPIEQPKPVKLSPEFSPGDFRVNYGGKGAYVGADVWYIHTKPGSSVLAPIPAKLYERSVIDPEKWNLAAKFVLGAKDMRLMNIEFSETPKLGCWCWPVIPDVSGDEDELDRLTKPEHDK